MSETALVAQQSSTSRANALEVLAYILGVIALVGSIVIGGSYLGARAGAAKSQKDGTKAAQEAADSQFTAKMHRQILEIEADTDLKRVESDNLKIQIAEIQGRSTQQARSELAIDRERVRTDRMVIDSERMMDALSGDPHVAEAEERVRACESSLAVWSAVKERDEHLLYALAALWVAFGFAWALPRPR